MRNSHGLSALALVLLIPMAGARGQASTCAPSTNDYARAVLSGTRYLASDAGQDAAMWRAQAKLPQVSASSVAPVTSDSVCALAAAAISSLPGGSATKAVWVVAVGPSHYLVFGDERRSAGRLLGAILDSSLNWLADIVL